jgi:hypothetical protein
MLLKITLALALGSLSLIVMKRLVESDDEALLQEQIEAQLQALRAHLFQR